MSNEKEKNLLSLLELSISQKEYRDILKKIQGMSDEVLKRVLEPLVALDKSFNSGTRDDAYEKERIDAVRNVQSLIAIQNELKDSLLAQETKMEISTEILSSVDPKLNEHDFIRETKNRASGLMKLRGSLAFKPNINLSQQTKIATSLFPALAKLPSLSENDTETLSEYIFKELKNHRTLASKIRSAFSYEDDRISKSELMKVVDKVVKKHKDLINARKAPENYKWSKVAKTFDKINQDIEVSLAKHHSLEEDNKKWDELISKGIDGINTTLNPKNDPLPQKNKGLVATLKDFFEKEGQETPSKRKPRPAPSTQPRDSKSLRQTGHPLW